MSAITDSVLQTSDGTEAKSVDEILLGKFHKTVLEAAERPAASDARDEFKAFVATRFDFRDQAGECSQAAARQSQLDQGMWHQRPR